MMKLRYPKITANRPGADFHIPLPVDPIRQIESYMHQLVDDLNVALDSVDAQATAAKTLAENAASGGAATDKDSQSTFNSIKSLIIKSADIVNAYYEVISDRLEGEYVAQSDFGTYREETAQDITENSTSIERLFENMQTILTDIENVEHTLIEVNAHIKSGLLYYDDAGAPVYGLEIGQKTKIGDEEVFNKYARFTANKLSFYDSNDNEVAYISDKKLYITHVEVTVSFKIGGLVDTVLSGGSVVTRYVVPGGDG